MTNAKVLATFLTLGLITACTTSPGGAGEPTGGVTLELRPLVKAGDYAAQAVVERNTKTSIDHLTVTLQRMEPTQGERLIRTVAKAELDEPIRFTNLKPHSTYWIEAKAYKAADESLPSNLISEPATVSISVGIDDAVIVLEGQALAIQLKDVPFSGSRETRFDVRDGGYVTTDPAILSIAP